MKYLEDRCGIESRLDLRNISHGPTDDVSDYWVCRHHRDAGVLPAVGRCLSPPVLPLPETWPRFGIGSET